MRDDFAIIIISHGRPNDVKSVNTLRANNWQGKWFILLDDEDETIDEYRRNFGDDRILVFCKQEYIPRMDTMDAVPVERSALMARHAIFDVAKSLGLQYFLMLDDDILILRLRGEDGKCIPVLDIEELFERTIDFLEESNALCVGYAQGGDFIGGAVGNNFHKGILRKCANNFFCKVDRKIDFRGRINEDIVALTTLGSRGNLFMSATRAQWLVAPTQSIQGGMTEEYQKNGTYLKSFYPVVSMPSAVKIITMNTKNERIHHMVKWSCCVPMIMSERWKKCKQSAH